MEIDKEKIKSELLNFTEIEVKKFLEQNKEKEFYAFAYDCNAEYGEVNLCFNTEEDFSKTLQKYQSGEFSHHYQTKEDIFDLKYNTGDWDYQCFSTLWVINQEKLDVIFEQFEPDDFDKLFDNFIEEIMVICTEVLIEFSKTKIFELIPKTENFKFFCIDHDEDFESAENRLRKINNNR